MHRPRQLISQQLVDPLMPSHLTLTRKRITHQHHAKVAFGAGGHAVPVTFIFHLEVFGSQSLPETLFDLLLNNHTEPANKT